MFNKVIILSKHITKKPRRKKKRWSPESTSVWTLESYTLPGVGVGSCEPKTLVLFPSCADAAPVLDRFLRMATAPFMCNLCRLWAEQGLDPPETPPDGTPGAANVPDVGVAPNSAGRLRSSQSSGICTVRPVFAVSEPITLIALRKDAPADVASSTGASELSSRDCMAGR